MVTRPSFGLIILTTSGPNQENTQIEYKNKNLRKPGSGVNRMYLPCSVLKRDGTWLIAMYVCKLNSEENKTKGEVKTQYKMKKKRIQELKLHFFS